jgi:predicted RNA-binding Zn-ribbon protein involved in translation (DUF1610 family)
MDYASTISTREGTEVTCDNCGATMDVVVAKQSGHNEREDFYCPACGKRHYMRASMPIAPPKLISPRTDGKTDQYINKPED